MNLIRKWILRVLAGKYPVIMNIEVTGDYNLIKAAPEFPFVFHNNNSLERVLLKLNGDYSRVGYTGKNVTAA